MKTLILLAALALSACATQSTAPAQYYRAVGQSDQLAISGTLSQSRGFLWAPDNDVSIFINGQRVTGGKFGYGSAEFSGQYLGKPVLADCSVIDSGSMILGGGGKTRLDVKCAILIAGDRAASLLLVP